MERLPSVQEFKCCPFCGGSAMLCKQSLMVGASAYSVVCLECSIEVSIQANPLSNVEFNENRAAKRMIDAWNRRVLDG